MTAERQTMSIHLERTRTKRLAELAGLDTSPWENADRDLKAMLDAEKQREADESAQRELTESEKFRVAYEAHAIARAQIDDLRRREAKENQAAREFGKAGSVAWEKCRNAISHPAGIMTLAQLRDPKKPALMRLLPKDTSREEFLLAGQIHDVLVRAQNCRQQIGCQLDALRLLEAKYPALADLREGQQQDARV
jgi:hypothetical protein